MHGNYTAGVWRKCAAAEPTLENNVNANVNYSYRNPAFLLSSFSRELEIWDLSARLTLIPRFCHASFSARPCALSAEHFGCWNKYGLTIPFREVTSEVKYQIEDTLTMNEVRVICGMSRRD